LGFLFELGLSVVVPVALLAGWGVLVGRWLLRGRYLAFLPWLAPGLGLALVASLGPSAGVLGVPLRVSAWPILGLAVAGWLLVARMASLRAWCRAHIPALVVSSAALMLALAPVASVGQLTVVGNSIDGISYNVRSEYLQDNPLRHPAEISAGKPYLAWVAAQIDHLRVGDVYYLGFVSLLLGRRTFELFTVLAALAHALSAFGTYFWCRTGLGAGRRAAIVGSSLVAINNTLIWPALDCSFSEVVALGLVPLALTVSAIALRRPDNRLAVALGVLLSGLAAVYPVFCIVVLSAVGATGAVAMLTFGGRPRAMARFRVVYVAVATMALANPFGVWRAAQEQGFYFGMMAASVFEPGWRGNILVFPPVVEVFGLVSHAAAAHGIPGWGEAGFLTQGLGLVALGLAVLGAWRLGRRRATAALVPVAVALALAFHQRFLANQPTGYAYGYSKAVVLLAVLLCGLVGAGAAVFLARGGAPRLAAAAALVALAATSANHVVWTLKHSLLAIVVSPALVKAAAVAGAAAGEGAVEIRVTPGIQENWLGYLLRDSLVEFTKPNAIHTAQTRPLPEPPRFVLHGRADTGEAGGYSEAGTLRSIWKGDTFELSEKLDNVLSTFPAPSARWDRGAAMSLSLEPARRELSLRLAGSTWRWPTRASEARTVQVSIASSDELVIDLPGRSPTLAPAAWLLDIDLGCAALPRLLLKSGFALVGPVRVLSAHTGVPDQCFEALPSPDGLLSWKVTMHGSEMSALAEVVPPTESSLFTYRIGLHVGGGNPAEAGWFGVWSVDLPPDGRPHRARITLDLSTREGRATVDGKETVIDQAARGVATGTFQATLALWRLELGQQVAVAETFSFEKPAGGAPRLLSEAKDVVLWWSAN
jgi:hypothetical protein